MTAHLLKLIWNRKRANFLIVTEILLSFLVLAAVTTIALHYWRNYQAPLGFSYERLWDIVVRVPRGMDSTPAAQRERLALMVRLIDAVREKPEVEAVDHIRMPAYRNWSWGGDITLKDDRSVEFNGNGAGDQLAETTSMPVVEGRWFSAEDAGQNWDAVVLNRAMAREIFGEAPAAGQMLPVNEERRPAQSEPNRPRRVVGVIADFRQFGEYSTPGNYMFVRNDIHTAAAAALPKESPERDARRGPARLAAELPGVLVLRVAPGVTAAFEEQLLKTLQPIAPDWSFSMQPVGSVRASYLRDNHLTPLAIMGMVAGFLLLMVTLGLSGVMWQNVTQRIRELGLRRAKGADRVRIRRQIFMEIALMTGIAMALGTVLLAQVPMLGWLGPVPPGLYGLSLLLAGALLFLLTSFCGWYPSLLATRIPPAEALRYE